MTAPCCWGLLLGWLCFLFFSGLPSASKSFLKRFWEHPHPHILILIHHVVAIVVIVVIFSLFLFHPLHCSSTALRRHCLIQHLEMIPLQRHVSHPDSASFFVELLLRSRVLSLVALFLPWTTALAGFFLSRLPLSTYVPYWIEEPTHVSSSIPSQHKQADPLSLSTSVETFFNFLDSLPKQRQRLAFGRLHATCHGFEDMESLSLSPPTTPCDRRRIVSSKRHTWLDNFNGPNECVPVFWSGGWTLRYVFLYSIRVSRVRLRSSFGSSARKQVCNINSSTICSESLDTYAHASRRCGSALVNSLSLFFSLTLGEGSSRFNLHGLLTPIVI